MRAGREVDNRHLDLPLDGHDGGVQVLLGHPGGTPDHDRVRAHALGHGGHLRGAFGTLLRRVQERHVHGPALYPLMNVVLDLHNIPPTRKATNASSMAYLATFCPLVGF